MAERSSAPLAKCIRAAVLDVASPAADGDLLATFVRHLDPAAFEALVRRHGSLVAAACRAILPNPADADDASQATFVLLYRKAHTIRSGRTLAGWLLRVARRAALEVKKSATRRRGYEGQASRTESVPAVDLSWREACAVLHEELDALPPRYRLPLIACYLEGKTQSGTARALGWSAEVVRGRLDRGREKLRQRLRRRGVTLSAAVLAGAAVPPAVTAVNLPAVLMPTPAVAAIVRSMTSSAARVWSGFAGLSLAAGLVIGTVVLGAGSNDPPAKPAPPAKAPVAEQPVARQDAFGDPLPDGAVARLGTVRFNHGDGLKELLYTPDGKSVVSVGTGVARVWDADTGAERLRFSTGKSEWNELAALTPDGKQLVLVLQTFRNDPLRVFDLATGKEVRSTTLPVRRNELNVSRPNALSPDGRLAALHTPDKVLVFDLEAVKELHALPKNGKDMKSVSFAGPDLLVTVDASRKIEVWEARTGKAVRSFEHGDPVGTVVGSPDGKLLATLAHPRDEGVSGFPEKDVLQIWDLSTGTRKFELASRPKRFFVRAGFSADGKTVHVYSQTESSSEVTVWDTTTGERTAELPGVTGQATAVSPDGKRLAAGVGIGKFGVFDLRTGKSIAPDDGIGWWAGAVWLSRSGDRAITLGKQSMTTWDTATGRPVASTTMPDHLFERAWCRFSPDGRYVVTVQTTGKDGRVVVWDVAASKAIQTIPVAWQPYDTAAAFSHDSSRLALRLGATQASITVRDVKTGKELTALKHAANDYPGHLFFAADGQTHLVTGKRTVGYSLSDGKELFGWTMTPEATNSKGQIGIAGAGGVMREEDRLAWRTLVVSPDGTLTACVLSAGWAPNATIADRIALCDARTGKVLRRWGDSGKQSRGHEVLAFSACGRLLASSDSYVVHVWEVATGKEVRTFRGHQNEIENLAFSGNSRRVASCSHDSTVLVWDLSETSRTEADPPAWWADLLSDDAAKAYAAAWRLADAADDAALPLLRKHLRPYTAADGQKARKLVAELDSDEFRIRDRASKELTNLGRHAEPALRAGLDRTSSAEARNRIEQLLAKIVGPPSSGEMLRTSRALAVLESKGTAAAKELIRELAAGVPDAWLTREAKAALRRVERR